MAVDIHIHILHWLTSHPIGQASPFIALEPTTLLATTPTCPNKMLWKSTEAPQVAGPSCGQRPMLHSALSLSLTPGLGHCHDHDGDPDTRSQDPDAYVDQLGLGWCPEVQGLDWMADGNVAVHAHHRECEDACKHVVVVDGEHGLTQQLSERPRLHQVLGTLEGQRAGGQRISQGQIEDVDVGGGLQLSVPWKEEHG